MLAWVVRYLLFAFGNATELVFMYYLGILLHGICYDFFFVTGQIYVDKAAPKAIQASAQGFITLVTYGVGMLIGSWVSGPVVDRYATTVGEAVSHDWTAIWLWPASMAFVIILLFAFFFDGGKARDARPQPEERENMATLDWIVIAAYFLLLLGLTWWVILRGKDTAEDYFLSGRSLGWLVVGASIFASNIGSEHLVGLAGAGATSGVALAHYELHAWCLLVLGWVMVPFYMRSRVYTMPEFLERRFSGTARTVLSLISLVAYVLTKIAVGIFAGGVVSGTLIPEWHVSLGGLELDSFWIGSLAVVILTGLYTVLGGMRAVAYTEAVQTAILVLGSAVLTWYGLEAIGGWGAFRAALPSDMFNLWKPLVPAGMQGTWAPVKEAGRIAWYFNGNYPWLGMLFCAPIIGLWYWCTDQYIVQRTLGAPNEREARRGAIFASLLKLLPVFIFIIPGMLAVALAVTGKIPALQQSLLDANGQLVNSQAQAAFPLMVQHVLPVGVRGPGGGRACWRR